MKLAYYPGCTLHGTAREYDASTKAVCKASNIELTEIEDWNCCGALEAIFDKELSMGLSARNNMLAQRTGLDLVIPCSICSHNLSRADMAMRNDESFRAKMEKALGERYRGIRVRHLLDILVNDVGIDTLSSKFIKPLKGIKAVPYYGCLLVRPSEVGRFDNPENPTSLDNLIRAAGAECLPFTQKTKCCGGNLLMSKQDYAFIFTKKLFDEAKAAGADCIVVACPMCHMLLDGQQSMVEEAHNTVIGMPVLYFTQLIGLAMGLSEKELELDKNMVSPARLLDLIIEGGKE
ncbi:heterodisulfide reductase, subunit B [Candidatus Methanoperedens nitroreducens]|uniref:Heterodisulfide reductase, subunit B n=1 Tax=Candidatus Methanoperedens nitratireducens TaxID=1392998 RepID=A0A062V264_9EURY|nr:CoB--CoM heterodisulfide reductase iron-sulfur subunit B family protein [Candidatus Methanoperedens nitroreducens]KCZ71427.1 heterodisulfide reductase, subunit B [Candidatus Methanoperedens nitroreducens]MDJ1421053.1 CoB--CoM heterodisulfide reductase iron-sulfur subunit B family protein [Candidatus Methanoperedens sp.]